MAELVGAILAVRAGRPRCPRPARQVTALPAQRVSRARPQVDPRPARDLRAVVGQHLAMARRRRRRPAASGRAGAARRWSARSLRCVPARWWVASTAGSDEPCTRARSHWARAQRPGVQAQRGAGLQATVARRRRAAYTRCVDVAAAEVAHADAGCRTARRSTGCVGAAAQAEFDLPARLREGLAGVGVARAIGRHVGSDAAAPAGIDQLARRPGMAGGDGAW